MHTLVIHGGAGTLRRESMSAETEQAFRTALRHALEAGHAVLMAGGDSLTAVERAVNSMEDCPLFNAGRGSTFTLDGTIEMDAAIMEGAGRKAGAVAMVRGIRNPISLARRVMEHSPHVLLCGEGAHRLAREGGVATEPDAYFHTDWRWRAMQASRDPSKGGLSEDIVPGKELLAAVDQKFGTVGAVALDAAGNLAAATSTGGTNAKLPGRIGDTPIIGAGTYADNATCAVSATGHGEYFIRNATAHEIASLMRHAGRTLEQAADEVVNGQLVELGGRGGVVAIDRQGNLAMPFNTSGMYRGFIRADGSTHIAIFKGEQP